MEKIELQKKVIEKMSNDTKRQVCRLKIRKESFSIFDSHMGGVPYCPHDAHIPENEEGKQLWLCAQINFAQMPEMDNFPQSGILQIFLSEFDYDGVFGLGGIDYTEQRNWRVIYHENVDETVTVQEVQGKMKVDWEDEKPWHIPDRPLKICYDTIDYEGITRDDYRFDSLFEKTFNELFPNLNLVADDIDYYHLYDLCQTHEERTYCSEGKDSIEGHGCKISGFPAFEQYDMREDDYEEWDILLLQIDTWDDDLDNRLNLEGLGIASFFIRVEDLKNLDFTQAMGDWATS
jgi:uncharacterized protein YwqG